MSTPDQQSTAGASEQTRSEQSLQSPHDRLLNQTLQQLEAARALLTCHLPSDVARHLKLDTLAPVDTSFIDRNLRRRFADRLFSVEVSEDVVRELGMKTNYVYVFVLIDHKSTDEPHVLVQMLGYIVRIWENAIENNQPLVPIIPWVIYNGVRPWRAACSLDQLIPVPESWKRYVPGLELAILDVSRMDDGAMQGHPILQMALMLLKYGREPTLEDALRRLFEVLALTFTPEQAKNLLDTLRVYIMSVNPVVGEQKMNDLVTEFWPVQPEPGSVADQLLKKGQAEGEKIGEVRGEARGEALGLAKGIRALESMLRMPLSSDGELVGKPLAVLQEMFASLQRQIEQRLN